MFVTMKPTRGRRDGHGHRRTVRLHHARRPSPAPIRAGPEPIKTPSVDREEESNPVGVRAQFETPLPQSLPQSSTVTGSRPTLALVDAAPNFHKSGPLPSKRLISWGSARNRRSRTGREAVEVVGVGPWVPCQLARPRPSPPRPVSASRPRPRPERHPNFNSLLYYIGV